MFDIKHTACNTVHRCNEVIYHIENRDFFILIYTKTEAVFEIDGCKQIVAEGSIVLLPPDVKARYYGNSNEYIEQIAREKLDMYLPNERVYIDIGK